MEKLYTEIVSPFYVPNWLKLNFNQIFGVFLNISITDRKVRGNYYSYEIIKIIKSAHLEDEFVIEDKLLHEFN